MYSKIFNLILLVITGAFAISFCIMIIFLFPVYNGDKDTLIAGVLGMFGGFAGAIGAYIAARMQITSQIEQLKIESIKKARPFITTSDLQAKVDLSNVKLNEDAMLMIFDYYDETKELAIRYNDGKVGFFQVRFYGPEIILNCELNLYLDNEKYEKHHYVANLEYLKNGVEVLIPIPFVTKPKPDNASPDRLEFTYKTIENEKFLYEYNFIKRYQKLTLLRSDYNEVIYENHFEETIWTLPNKKK